MNNQPTPQTPPTNGQRVIRSGVNPFWIIAAIVIGFIALALACGLIFAVSDDLSFSGLGNRLSGQTEGEPTAEPTAQLTAEPTAQPTAEPTAQPTAEPTAQPTAEPTAQPTAEPTAMPTDVTTFEYEPGGESFGDWATDVTLSTAQAEIYEDQEEEVVCGRIWRATNLVELPWVSIFCNWETSKEPPELQWPHPTQLTVTGNGIVSFDLLRDLTASEEISPDPYDVANVTNSPLGLAWQVQGFNGAVCVNDVCQELSGGGVYQIPFPHDYEGAISVRIVVDDGQVQFWQGEKITSEDTWELPTAEQRD
jgi:hypothetical protein